MDYISAGEIAKKWGIKQRQVQTLLANGRIPGAIKYGRFWMIPHDEKKPSDLRRKDMPEETVHPPVSDDHNAARTNEGQLYEECGTAYMQGDFEQVKQQYCKAEKSKTEKLLIASMAISAAVSTGDYPFYLEVETYLKGIVRDTEDERISASAELALSTAYVTAYAPRMVHEWLKNGDFSAVDENERLTAIYMRTKYFQSIGDYTSMLATAETALVFCDSAQTIVYPGVYLKLACAAACHSLHRIEEAEQWLLDAMHSSLPYGFITPYAEAMPVFGGLIEKLLMQEYPAQSAAIISQWEYTYTNWVTFHNLFTKNNVTQMLSLREYETATLTVEGLSNKEIAKRMHISDSRQKAVMNNIYTKLRINNRKELGEYICSAQKDSTILA